MRLVGTNILVQGAVLASPVYSAKGRIILAAGIELNEIYINRLKKLGITKVYIVDIRFEDVEIMQSLDFSTRNEIEKVVGENYTTLHKKGTIDEYSIKNVAKKMVDYIREYREKGISILSLGGIEEYVVTHTVNVAILTAFLGNKMSYKFDQMCDLLVGALVHDLGREDKPLEDPDHIKKGFDVLRKCRGLNLLSSIVAYEHHENYNGTGYPRKLKDVEISEFSRVVRVADYYDNVLNGYENNGVCRMPHQAFEGLLAVSGSILDPEVLIKFRDTIIFYPNGCSVKLNDGSQGVVVKQNMGSPQRPVVRLFNEDSIIGEVNLIDNLTLFIQEVIYI